MFLVFTAVLCFLSLSQADPPGPPVSCQDLFHALDPLDPLHLQGRWEMVAGSVNNSANRETLRGRDSVTIELQGSIYTQSHRHGEQCQYNSHRVAFRDHGFTLNLDTVNFTGTFYHTACTDCLVFRLDVETLRDSTTDFYLFGRTKQVEVSVMAAYLAQVECLHMPPPILMDPTKESCPPQAAVAPDPDHQEQPDPLQQE